MDEDAWRALRVVVRGRVQGVAFRWHTQERARALRLSGWVRNLADGGVEAWVQGPHSVVEEMLGFLERGPAQARVDDCVVHEERVRAMTGFAIER